MLKTVKLLKWLTANQALWFYVFHHCLLEPEGWRRKVYAFHQCRRLPGAVPPKGLVGIAIFDTEIEQRIAYAEALTMGKTIFEWAARGAAVAEIQSLTHELLDVLNEQNLRTSPKTKAAHG